jgi:hypothetical protein
VTRARAAALVAALAACGPRPGPGGGAAADAIIYLRSNVRDAQVYVDGRFVAALDALGGGIALEPGSHRVELRRDSYFSSYVELELARGERKRLAVELAVILP